MINSKYSEGVIQPASWRDPSGFVYFHDGAWYRQVNQVYATQFDLLISSGLYQVLVDKHLLVPHQEIPLKSASAEAYKTLRLQPLSFVSYPYEWCFNQLKDAALLTLEIQKMSLERQMVLKDATPFNVQFEKGRPIFIDTLSFEKYDPSKPWVAYRQFCQCFLFPLMLAHYCSVNSQKWMISDPEGISAQAMDELLPLRSRLSLSTWLDVILQKKITVDVSAGPGRASFSQAKMLRIVRHLQEAILKLRWRPPKGPSWSSYYEEINADGAYLNSKESWVRQFCSQINCHQALDLGCNQGRFSKVFLEYVDRTIAVDEDSGCINNLYVQLKKGPLNLWPLCIDLSNPSPAAGYRNSERLSFASRSASDLVVALALIHHLVLTHNIPLAGVATLLSDLCLQYLIVEFVPMQDPRAQQLIERKTSYHFLLNESDFELAFKPFFFIQQKQALEGSERILYLMKKVSEVS